MCACTINKWIFEARITTVRLAWGTPERDSTLCRALIQPSCENKHKNYTHIRQLLQWQTADDSLGTAQIPTEVILVQFEQTTSMRESCGRGTSGTWFMTTVTPVTNIHAGVRLITHATTV